MNRFHFDNRVNLSWEKASEPFQIDFTHSKIRIFKPKLVVYDCTVWQIVDFWDLVIFQK